MSKEKQFVIHWHVNGRTVISAKSEEAAEVEFKKMGGHEIMDDVDDDARIDEITEA